LHGWRLFVVEDEPLVAMMLQGLLTDLGAQVVGPFGSLDEAFSAPPRECDAALLDVNVGGAALYPLSEEPSNAGLPLVFRTGYQAKGTDRRFGEAPGLTKPVEAADLIATLQSLQRNRVAALTANS